jgi:hypothetical protein
VAHAQRPYNDFNEFAKDWKLSAKQRSLFVPVDEDDLQTEVKTQLTHFKFVRDGRLGKIECQKGAVLVTELRSDGFLLKLTRSGHAVMCKFGPYKFYGDARFTRSFKPIEIAIGGYGLGPRKYDLLGLKVPNVGLHFGDEKLAASRISSLGIAAQNFMVLSGVADDGLFEVIFLKETKIGGIQHPAGTILEVGYDLDEKKNEIESITVPEGHNVIINKITCSGRIQFNEGYPDECGGQPLE